MPRLNDARIAIKLIATTNEQVEGLLSMLCQQIDPDRIVATLEPRSTEVIRVDTSTEPVALDGRTRSRAPQNNDIHLTE
jgi:hypothetical protein